MIETSDLGRELEDKLPNTEFIWKSSDSGTRKNCRRLRKSLLGRSLLSVLGIYSKEKILSEEEIIEAFKRSQIYNNEPKEVFFDIILKRPIYFEDNNHIEIKKDNGNYHVSVYR
ncbi:MAG: hypothetical protein Q7S56_01495 [Nanoarchaeota archaeon]|nr:hypothetical protein [Nanoarchaeota archaeon]